MSKLRYLVFEGYEGANYSAVDWAESLEKLGYDLEYWYVYEDYKIFDMDGQIIKLRLGDPGGPQYDPPVIAYETGDYDLNELLNLLRESWYILDEDPHITIKPCDMSDPQQLIEAIWSADRSMENPIRRFIVKWRERLWAFYQ